jgi:hypothetical protein
MHIEELDSDPHNPFVASDEPTDKRWMLTTCVAGIAGSVVIGSALLGFLADDSSDSRFAEPGSALAANPSCPQRRLQR